MEWSEAPWALTQWRHAYVQGEVTLSEFEEAVEQYLKERTIPHDNRVHGYLRG
jgi:hypothetical protein